MAGNLRERRRLQTTKDIQQATIRLVLDRGFDNVTVDEISAAVGVSVRTFFNYFPNKESAIVWAPLDITDEEAAAFEAKGPGPYRQILGDVVDLAVGDMANSPPSRELIAALLEIAKGSVAVTSAMMAQFDRYQSRLAALVARRIGAQPADEVPVLIAALAMTVTRTGIDRWANVPDPDGDDTPLPYVRRAAELIQSFFAGDVQPFVQQ